MNAEVRWGAPWPLQGMSLSLFRFRSLWYILVTLFAFLMSKLTLSLLHSHIFMLTSPPCERWGAPWTSQGLPLSFFHFLPLLYILHSFILTSHDSTLLWVLGSSLRDPWEFEEFQRRMFACICDLLLRSQHSDVDCNWIERESNKYLSDAEFNLH